MSNARDAYDRNSLRVARLLAWLEFALERHDERADDFDECGRLWPMVGNLAHVESELKAILGFISGMTEGEIEHALNDGGQGNE